MPLYCFRFCFFVWLCYGASQYGMQQQHATTTTTTSDRIGQHSTMQQSVQLAWRLGLWRKWGTLCFSILCKWLSSPTIVQYVLCLPINERLWKCSGSHSQVGLVNCRCTWYADVDVHGVLCMPKCSTEDWQPSSVRSSSNYMARQWDGFAAAWAFPCCDQRSDAYEAPALPITPQPVPQTSQLMWSQEKAGCPGGNWQ